MRKSSLLLISLLAQTTAHAGSCLDTEIVGKDIKVITGEGISYEDARIDLYRKLPQIGVLQSINLKTTKVSSDSSFSENSILSKSINATFDHISIQNCRLPDGRYASSAAFPLDGVSYLPKGRLRGVFEEPIFKKEFATFKYANRVCGGEIYTVLITMNRHYSISGGRTVLEKNVNGIHQVVICGTFKLKSRWFNHGWTDDYREVFANRYNLIYLGSYRQKDIRDLSIDLGLEMIKNAMKPE